MKLVTSRQVPSANGSASPAGWKPCASRPSVIVQSSLAAVARRVPESMLPSCLLVFMFYGGRVSRNRLGGHLLVVGVQ